MSNMVNPGSVDASVCRRGLLGLISLLTVAVPGPPAAAAPQPNWAGCEIRHCLVLAQSDAGANRGSFSVTVLSRGSGVPENTLEALKLVRDLLADYRRAGSGVTVTETRIGLEGERRLCATFADEALATRAWRQVEQILNGVDLAQMKQEPCNS